MCQCQHESICIQRFINTAIIKCRTHDISHHKGVECTYIYIYRNYTFIYTTTRITLYIHICLLIHLLIPLMSLCIYTLSHIPAVPVARSAPAHACIFISCPFTSEQSARPAGPDYVCSLCIYRWLSRTLQVHHIYLVMCVFQYAYDCSCVVL